MRILVVDDEDDMCWALRRILELEGHSPATATSAEEALRLAGEAPFELAFVDAKLPDMDGLDLVRCLREVREGLPCILVSGYLYDDDDSVEKARGAGLIQGFISKPFPFARIREILDLAACSR